MSTHAEYLADSSSRAELMALRAECEAMLAFYAGLTAEVDARLGDLAGLPEFMDSIRKALDGGAPKPAPLRVVREEVPECGAAAPESKPITFKAGSISVAILTLMEADPGRTAPWSVGQVTEVLQQTVDTSRNRVGANLEHIFQRGALVKVPVPEDRAHVYFKVGAPWSAVG